MERVVFDKLFHDAMAKKAKEVEHVVTLNYSKDEARLSEMLWWLEIQKIARTDEELQRLLEAFANAFFLGFGNGAIISLNQLLTAP